MCHPSFPTCDQMMPHLNLARLARAKKRSKNNNTHMDSARKAQRVDYDMLESGDVLDDMTIIRYNAQVNCDVNTDEVNTSSTVTDMDEGTIPNVSTVTNSEIVQDNSLSDGQQLQAAMEHIMTLTHQNNVLQMECHQLMAANTELL